MEKTAKEINKLVDKIVDSWELDSLINYSKEKLTEYYWQIDEETFTKDYELYSHDTIRDVLEQRIEGTIMANEDKKNDELVKELADIACSTLGISEKEQNEPW